MCVGATHDTAEFAVEAIRRWWFRMGRLVYPKARQILIAADGGGSNGARVRLWKMELQRLADELGMILHVRHFPPGTSKRNKIEHRMFCRIAENWLARPLTTVLAIVNMIGNTRTRGGLSIQSELNETHFWHGISHAQTVLRRLPARDITARKTLWQDSAPGEGRRTLAMVAGMTNVGGDVT